MKLLIPAVFGLVLLTGASGPGPLKDSEDGQTIAKVE